MNKMRLQTNSLRLANLLGGGNKPQSDSFEWFYNGSVKFEKDNSQPRIFRSLQGAITYFTEHLSVKNRAPGQFVTFANASPRNWMLYIYVGKQLDDMSYSNAENWIMFGEIRPDPYTDIEAVLSDADKIEETLQADSRIQEALTNIKLG